MKKLFFIAAQVLSVCVAHALTFTWSTGPNAVEDSSAINLASGSLTYLVWDSGGNGFAGLDSSGNVQGDDVLISQGALTGAGVMGSKTVTFSDGQSYTTGSGGSAILNAGAANISMYFVAFDATTIGSALNYDVSTSPVTKGMTPSSGSPVTGYAFTDAQIVPGNWVPIPEPTSMALFGLGAAVLGLRRRFKKKA